MGVETTTPFAVPILAAVLGVLISVLFITKYGDRFALVGAVPFLLLVGGISCSGKMPNLEMDEEEAVSAHITLGWHLLLGGGWAGWVTMLYSLPGVLLLKRPYPSLKWLSMMIWTVPLCLFARVDRHSPGIVVESYIRVMWDPPLIATAQLARLFDHRLIGPFYNDIDSSITVGSFPMQQDVNAMKAHGVVGVVNMCIEWPGPAEAYAEAGIKQIRLRTVDTTAPTLASLQAGIAFIQETLATSPEGSRIFIHCKAGRGRAGTMAIAWYIAQGYTKEEALRLVRARRKVVSTVPVEYDVIKALELEYSNSSSSSSSSAGGIVDGSGGGGNDAGTQGPKANYEL